MLDRRRFTGISAAVLAALTGCTTEARSGHTDAPASPVVGSSASPAPVQTQAVAVPLPSPTSTVTAATPAWPQAPELLGGQAWINSEPLTLARLRGKVVLVEFWTYTCYNCQNVTPALRDWWAKYRTQDFVIIGVHSPEFQREHELANVQQAVQEAQIGWPVVQDNDFAIWRAYSNRYWPAMYLLNQQGQIIYTRIGEGAYDLTEQQIVQVLG